jgi:hypothetical protein
VRAKILFQNNGQAGDGEEMGKTKQYLQSKIPEQ